MRLFLILIFFTCCLQGHAQAIEKTFVRTDKDLYQPEDTLWFKGYVFDQHNLLADSSLNMHIFLQDESGKKVADSAWPIVSGTTHGYLILPENEGRYFLQALTMNMMNLPVEAAYRKEVFIRSPLVDVVNISGHLNQETYQLGDEIIVDVRAALSEKEAAANQRFIYELWAGKEQIIRKRFRTDDQGQFQLQGLRVPDQEEPLSLIITTAGADVGRNSTLSIPIKVDKEQIDLQFMPEGGHLVKGLNSKVAFKAITDQGEPIDIGGLVLNAQAEVVDSVSSFHMGMGYFYLRPEQENYTFQVTSPARLDTTFNLPKVQPTGHILSIVKDGGEQLIKVMSADQTDGPLKVVIRQHDTVISTFEYQEMPVAFFRLPEEKLDVGTIKISLEGPNGLIHSERLYFSNSLKPLQIDIQFNKQDYLPRDQVIAKLKVSTAEGLPVRGNFSFSAIDDTQNPSPRPDQPHLMAQILLQSELKGTVPTPNFYFSKDPRATQALDLVMLTHGWRDYDIEAAVDYEVLSGVLIYKNRPKKVLANREISVFNTTNFSESIVKTNEKGRFSIPAHHFKYKGDSFLVVAKAEGKKEKPNLLIDVENRKALSDYKKATGAFNTKHSGYDFSIYEKKNKLYYDRFGNTLLLNSVEVFGKINRDSCMIFDYMYQYPWTVKKRGELDLDENDIVKVLKQVSYKVAGIGDVKAILPNRTVTLSKDVLYSFEHYREPVERDGVRRILSFPLTYLVSINCESTYRFGPNGQMSELLGSLDVSNIESIAIVDPLYTQGVYGDRYVGLVEIHTIDDVVVRRPYLQKFFTYTINSSQEANFYSPVYETEEAKKSPVPDLRTTIHWQHTVITNDNGEATIQFYNADRDNRIRITVEGMDSMQRFGFAQKDYRILLPASVVSR